MRQAEQVRERLQEVARHGGFLFDQLLRRYARERLVRSLVAAGDGGEIALCGGTAVEARLGVPHRLLRSAELRAPVGTTPEGLGSAIRDLGTDLARDGLLLDGASVRPRHLRERPGETAFGMIAFLTLRGAQVAVHLDVVARRAERPPAEEMDVPLLLDATGFRVPVLRHEVLMSDCVIGLLQRGSAHARMVDLYDAWLLSQVDPLADLGAALADAAENGRVPPVRGVPDVLSDDFARSAHARRHWHAFVRKSEPSTEVALGDAVRQVRELVLPILTDLA